MAASLNITSIVEISGSNQDRTICKKTTHASTPTEVLEQSPVLGSSAATIDLGDIAAGSGFFIWLEASVGNFYIKLGATSGTPGATDSHFYITEGTGYAIPLNANATAMPGIRVVGDSATAVLHYCLIG